MTVKTFALLHYYCKKSVDNNKNTVNIWASKIINNLPPNQRNRMITEGSCDTEDCSNGKLLKGSV